MDKGLNECVEVDALIVLGAGRSMSCNYSRAKQAVDYNHEIPIILTGGRGFLSKNMPKTEAEIMKEQLIKYGRAGIEERIIILETEAKNTKENFTKSKPTIDLINPRKIGVVTNKAHISRALKLAREIMPGYEFVPIPTNPTTAQDYFAEIGCWIYEHTKIPIENACNFISKYFKTSQPL